MLYPNYWEIKFQKIVMYIFWMFFQLLQLNRRLISHFKIYVVIRGTNKFHSSFWKLGWTQSLHSGNRARKLLAGVFKTCMERWGWAKLLHLFIHYRQMQNFGPKYVSLNIWRYYNFLILSLKWSSLHKIAQCLSCLPGFWGENLNLEDKGHWRYQNSYFKIWSIKPLSTFNYKS